MSIQSSIIGGKGVNHGALCACVTQVMSEIGDSQMFDLSSTLMSLKGRSDFEFIKFGESVDVKLLGPDQSGFAESSDFWCRCQRQRSMNS